MTDYTEIIEKYLRGQMSRQEEKDFKVKLKWNSSMRFQAFCITTIIKSKSY
jgi:hypothetical protein